MSRILLVDNGSLRATATLTLRKLALDLSALSGYEVAAVSLQHANKIPREELDGEPAQVVADYLREQLREGHSEFHVIPLFFGLSRALTSLLPDIQRQLALEFGEFRLNLCNVLYPLPAGDKRLAGILYDNIRAQISDDESNTPRIVLVDHGSPSPQVTEVRNRLRADLAALLPAGAVLDEAVMERRKGRDYDFNGQLLEAWLDAQAKAGVSDVIVSLMFLLPGRHAGAGGDIEEICHQAMSRFPALRVRVTSLIGDHPGLVDILHDRLNACINS